MMASLCFVIICTLISSLNLFAQATGSVQAEGDAQVVSSLKLKPKNGLFYMSMGSGNPQKEFQSNIGTGGFAFIMGGGYYSICPWAPEILKRNFRAISEREDLPSSWVEDIPLNRFYLRDIRISMPHWYWVWILVM